MTAIPLLSYNIVRSLKQVASSPPAQCPLIATHAFSHRTYRTLFFFSRFNKITRLREEKPNVENYQYFPRSVPDVVTLNRYLARLTFHLTVPNYTLPFTNYVRAAVYDRVSRQIEQKRLVKSRRKEEKIGHVSLATTGMNP